ncbi:MAG TPA: hypothetical protein VHB79_05515 [Polyangiaceae bacterium]|nr:hypothetical protein [Polyangiaceae bacterium]
MGYPYYVLVFPALALGYTLFMRSRQKQQTANYDQQYSNYRAGELATRLGLQVIKGDPSFNFMVTHANADIARGATDSKAIHIDIELSGEPFGVPLSLTYLNRQERETGFSSTTYKTWFDCRMAATAKQPFPPFEVTSRKTPMGSIVKTQTLPEMATGNPAVDAEFSVSTQEPALAQLLGQLLPEFVTLGSAGVHLVGDGQRISFIMNQTTAPIVASALYHAEVMSHGLSNLAKRLGG